MLTIDPGRLDSLDHVLRDRRDLLPQRDERSRELLHRAQLLPARQRVLLELVYRHHVSIRAVGRLLQMPPGTVSRAARRLWRRLAQPIAEELCRPACPLPPDTRAVAIDHFLAGRTRRQIALDRGLSSAKVRDHLQFTLGWHRAMTHGRRSQA